MTTERNAQGVDGLAEVMWLLKACAPGEWSVDRYAKRIFKIRGEMLPRGGARRCIATIGATTAYDNPVLDVENEVNAQLIAAAVNYLRSHGAAIRELVEADREYDAARTAYESAAWPEVPRQQKEQAGARMVAARNRRAAALRQVEGT